MAGFKSGSWLTLPRLYAYSAMLLVAYMVSIAYLIWTASGYIDYAGRPIGTDFANVWSSGRLVLEGRPEAAFDPEIQGPYQNQLLNFGPGFFYGWHYPPMFLAVAALLALLPYGLALAVWLATTGAFYIAVMQRICAPLTAPRTLVLAVAVAYPAVFANISHGHNGFLSAALIGGGLVLLPTRPAAAGALIGLLAYKPQYGLLVPFALLAVGGWRAIFSATATVIATMLLSALAFGMESWSAFVTFSAFTKEVVLENGGAGWFKLQGVFPTVRMLGGSVAAAYALQAVVSLGMIGFVVWLWRSAATHEQKAAGLILATMLATPYAYSYDTVLLAPAIAFLAVDGFKRGFAPYEQSLLAVLWVTPMLSRAVTEMTLLPIAVVVNALVLVVLVSKVERAERPARLLTAN